MANANPIFHKKTNFQKTDSVLEVGCGSGTFLKELDVSSLSGIDFSSDAISKINPTLKGDFKTAEATEIPFKDNSFDKVFSFILMIITMPKKLQMKCIGY